MISIIFCGDIRYCPYLKRYTERLDIVHAEYEVLFWNRSALSLKVAKNYKFYNNPSAENLGKGRKLVDFLCFRKWIKRQLALSKPDGIIFLSTLSGFFLMDVAMEYQKKYIFDIRDYSYENFTVFKMIEKRLILDSYFTAISSKGFKVFLPVHNYVIAHNFNREEMVEQFEFEKQSIPLQIIWNGTVRFFEYQRKFLDAFKNDPRFLLVYHGAGTDLEKYKKYCTDNNIKNVQFTGAYDNKDKRELLRHASFLNNCYGGRNGDQLRYAVSNRYYDGLVFHIPQIVEDGGYKAQETKRAEVGLCVEPTSDLPDKLYQYYSRIDEEKFNTACTLALEAIITEDNDYILKIDKFIEKFGKTKNQ